MKKLFYLIVLSILIIPISVKADMGAPEIKAVTVTPKNSEGATLYTNNGTHHEKSGTLKYGEKIKIQMETKDDGILYGCSYDDDACVKMSDVKTVNKNEKDKDDKAIYVGRVFAKEGVDIYEGPSYAYAKTNTSIPYKTEFKMSDLKGVGTWVYVEYNGVEGYVDVADAVVGQLFRNNVILGTNNKEYKEYYSTSGWDRKVYILVDGTYKSFDSDVLINSFQYSNKFTLEKDCKLYNKYDAGQDNAADTSSITTLKKGTSVEVLYINSFYDYESFYVKSGNQKGWLVSETDKDNELSFTCFNYDYEKLTKNDNYTEYDDWKVLAADYFKNSDSNDDPKTGDVITPDNKEDKKDDDKKTLFAGFTKDQIILISSIGAGVIVLTAIVTIILVNKKKNKKENSVQE